MKTSKQNKPPLPIRQALFDLGRIIKIGRKENSLTQQELADQVGVARMTIVRMEKGAYEIAIGHYLTAALTLNLQVLAWTDFEGLRTDSFTADYLNKMGDRLPKRIKTKK